MRAMIDQLRAVTARLLLIFALLAASTRSADAGSLTLAWDANIESDIAGYIVYYGTTSGSYTSSVDVGNVTSYMMTSLADGQRYYFALKAYNTNGLRSPYSTEVAGTVPTAGAPASLTTPIPGTTLSSSSVQFQWTAGVNVTSYRLSAGTTFGGTNLFDQSGLTSVSATITGLPTNGVRVYVRLWSLIGGMWRFSDYNYTATTVCTFSLNPTSASVGVGGSSGTFTVTAPDGCSRSAVSNANWITITGGASGTGNGTVAYTVAAATGTATRTGTVSIAGSNFTITQPGLTRVIAITGGLTFGSAQVGTTTTRTMTISNNGNSPLTVSGITYPAGYAGNWGGGTIAAGASQPVAVMFTPMAAMNYGGTIMVSADETAGIDTAAVSGTATGVLLVKDAFTGSNGSLLTAHVPDVPSSGTAWVATGKSPTPALQGGMAAVGSGTGHLQATLDSGMSDVIVAMDYTAGSGPGMGGVAFRLTDSNNYLLLETYVNQLQLYRRQGGTFTLLGSAALPVGLISGATHRIEVRASGSSIQGWWDGLQLLQLTETFQQQATRHGINWNSAYDWTSAYDNFIIAAAALPAAPAMPGTPAPAAGAVNVETATTLTWSATGATSYDISIGTTNPPPVAAVNAGSAWFTPTLAANSTYFWRVVARNAGGATAGPVWSFTTAAVAPQPAGTIVQDLFGGTNGTPLPAHVPDVAPVGAAWTFSGDGPLPALQNGAAAMTAGPGHTPLTIDAGVADVRVGVDYRVGTGAGMGGVVLRLTDASNFLVLETYSNQLQLYKRRAGAWTLLASAPLPAALMPGTVHRLEARAAGSTIEGWWDGVQLLMAVELFQQVATRHGVDWNSAYDPTSTYDNFAINTVDSAPPSPETIVQDLFSGTNGTTLPAHVPDVAPVGAVWMVSGGSPLPTLQNGAATITAGTGHTPLTIDAGVADVRVGVDYRVGTGAGMGGVVLRLTDASNFLVLETYFNQLQLYKRQAGTWTLLGSAPLPAALTPGTVHRIEARTAGSTIEGWWDGVQLLTAIEVFQSDATRHGVDWNSAYDPTSTYDNFTMRSR
jgi:fibronectin type III domain protein/HYDIN/CFA65/VesB family protein